MRRRALAASWFRVGIVLGDAGQDDRVAVRKLGDQGEFAAHRFDIAGQGRDQDFGALFQA